MSRPAAVVFFILVGATFAAFFVAQRLKGATPVVELRGARRPFSPNGDGRRDTKSFGVAVRSTDDLTLDVVDSRGNEVRRLVDKLHVQPFRPRRVRWNGRDDAGDVVPDGFYGVRVSLRRSGRSVIVPSKLRVDTRPPEPYVTQVTPERIVAPGTSGITLNVRRISRRSPTDVRLWRTDSDPPKPVAEGRLEPGQREWAWDGKVDGKPAPPGIYLAQVSVTDQAGNIGVVPKTVKPGASHVPGHPGITVRALAAQPPIGPVTAGQRVTVAVDSRHRPYAWRLFRPGEKHPVAKGKDTDQMLAFKAPDDRSGLYLLELTAGRDRLLVPILVQATRHAKILVVVPMATWLGRAVVDDQGDGLPDTLDDGGPVRWPRVLPVLPAGVQEDVVPLLKYMDRTHVNYDITSDLALMLDSGPRPTDRPGVLLVGAERWVSTPYARRLRRYVGDGGRLATIATDSLRRGVTVLRRRGDGSGALVRPTQPVDRDPFGARLGDIALLPAGTELRPVTGSAAAPLLSFWDGTLAGFGSAEESAPPAADDLVKVLAGVGVEPPVDDTNAAPEEPKPAITENQLGKGIVIRIGLPGWTQRLDKDGDVGQITRNAIDVLAGDKPKPRDLRPAG